MSLRIGSLFSGIGGLELGLERGIGHGAHTVFQVEQNAYCRAVLAKHWPDAMRFDDVRTVGSANLPECDVLCGGFPCQDISVSGVGAGLAGARSSLWGAYRRIVGELRPRYVVVENVAALLSRGVGTVLGGLADIGYDAEWSVISACAVGAPHLRERLFILAYANSQHGEAWVRAFADRSSAIRPSDYHKLPSPHPRAWMENPSALYGDADGVPDRVERGHALGNAVVPQVAEVVGRLIAQMETHAV